jgi:hypothetical protein
MDGQLQRLCCSAGPEQTCQLGRHALLDGCSDEISSMRVGSDVKVTIHVDRDLGPKDSSATLLGGNCPHMQWSGDEISSLEVTGNGPGLVAKTVTYEHPAAHQNPTIHTVSLGEYTNGENRHELLPADMMSLITLLLWERVHPAMLLPCCPASQAPISRAPRQVGKVEQPQKLRPA